MVLPLFPFVVGKCNGEFILDTIDLAYSNPDTRVLVQVIRAGQGLGERATCDQGHVVICFETILEGVLGRDSLRILMLTWDKHSCHYCRKLSIFGRYGGVGSFRSCRIDGIINYDSTIAESKIDMSRVSEQERQKSSRLCQRKKCNPEPRNALN